MSSPIDFSQPDAHLFIPSGRPADEVFPLITHVGIGAHPDDLEIMAFHGIRECYRRTDRRFAGIVCTDGAGSPRSGSSAGFSNADMKRIRREEQIAAAQLGDYGLLAMLSHPSEEVKGAGGSALRADLLALLGRMRPQTVYMHNPMDRHETHLAVFAATMDALRALPADRRPARVLGCEVWRGLDWLPTEWKVALDLSGGEDLFQSLVRVFDSQIAAGKRYDLAALGRARANATFLDSHQPDSAEAIWFAIDLTPLVRDSGIDLLAFVERVLCDFSALIRERLRRYAGRSDS